MKGGRVDNYIEYRAAYTSNVFSLCRRDGREMDPPDYATMLSGLARNRAGPRRKGDPSPHKRGRTS